MSETFMILGQINPGANNVTLYECPEQKQAIISVVVISNSTVSSRTVRLYAVPRGETISIGKSLAYDMTVAANTPNTTIKGITLRSGDSLVCYASASDVVFTIFGSEIS